MGVKLKWTSWIKQAPPQELCVEGARQGNFPHIQNCVTGNFALPPIIFSYKSEDTFYPKCGGVKESDISLNIYMSKEELRLRKVGT